MHSFLDGVVIGAGFQTSAKLGLLIAIGIIAHDVGDGLNTVTVVLAHGNPRRRALFWLIIDMLTPVVGAATALFLNLDGMLPSRHGRRGRMDPNRKNNDDTRTPEELLNIIEARGREVAEALRVLRSEPPQRQFAFYLLFEHRRLDCD